VIVRYFAKDLAHCVEIFSHRLAFNVLPLFDWLQLAPGNIVCVSSFWTHKASLLLFGTYQQNPLLAAMDWQFTIRLSWITVLRLFWDSVVTVYRYSLSTGVGQILYWHTAFLLDSCKERLLALMFDPLSPQRLNSPHVDRLFWCDSDGFYFTDAGAIHGGENNSRLHRQRLYYEHSSCLSLIPLFMN